MEPQIWTTKEIVGAVIATGLLSAAAREAFEWIKAIWRKKRELRYLGIMSAVALEGFAIECRNLFEGMEAQYDKYNAVGAISIPPPPALPADCDWRLLNPALLNELMGFGNKVRKAQASADFAAHFEGDTWSYVSEVRNLAETAETLAARIRQRVGL